MSNIFFISDHHFGHSNIIKPEYSGKFRPVKTMEEHTEWLIQEHNKIVSARDITYFLGDVSFSEEGLQQVGRMNGKKHLIMGNHDTFPIESYLRVFSSVRGLFKKYGYWLSHAPVHPNSLRGMCNLHGHMHQYGLDDSRYLNVSVERIKAQPISLDEARKITKTARSQMPRLEDAEKRELEK